MRIGFLRRRVVLQQEQRVPDGAGGYAVSWGTLATVWGRLEEDGGRELLAAGQVQARRRARLWIRYRNDVTEALRVAMGSRVWNIRAVLDEDGRKRTLVLVLEEGGGT